MFRRTREQAPMRTSLLAAYEAEIAAAEADAATRAPRTERTYTTTETHTVPMERIHEALGIIRSEGGFVVSSAQVGTEYQITVAL
jgi:hypothetical protein